MNASQNSQKNNSLSSQSAKLPPTHLAPRKPPDFPKASRNNQINIHRQRQLKDRLKLKWGDSEPGHFEGTSDDEGERIFGKDPQYEGLLVKGFGENQFNEGPLHDEHSSVHFDESTFLQRGAEESKVIHPKIEATKHSIVHKNHQTYITALPSSVLLDNSVLDSASVVHSYRRDIIKVPISKIQSHLEMSQSLAEHGYEEVADSFVDGKTEFCYLQPDKDNFYRYGLKTNFPAQNSVEYDDWTTISARGVLRFKQDGIELSTFDQIAKEKNVYEKLLRFKTFNTFWEWKMFNSWKRHVIRQKMERIVSFFFSVPFFLLIVELFSFIYSI
jgi:hypothetical protein